MTPQGHLFARRRRRLRWSILAAAVVAAVTLATVAAVAAVRHSGLELLDHVANEEAEAAARSVAHAIDTQVDNVKAAMGVLVADPTLADRLDDGDPQACAQLGVLASGANGVVLDHDGTEVCRYGPSAERAGDVERWAAGMGDQLVTDRDGTSVWFSPVPLDGLVLSATKLGSYRVVHWIPQDPLLRSYVARLGPRNLAMAFTPTGARRADAAFDLVDEASTAERDSDGYDITPGRGVGPLGVDAYWAEARTASGDEVVAVGVDPGPYDLERGQLSSNLLQIAALIGAVAFCGVLATLWWTGTSLRRLGDAIDEASDGIIDEPLPAGGPRETRRIADALTRLSETQVAADIAADHARADERNRIVTTLDVDIAAVLDDICADIARGTPVEHYRIELELLTEQLRGVVATLHPTALDRLGLRGAVASQVALRHGWVLAPGPEVAADPVVAGLIYSILAELWHRNPSGAVSISTTGTELRIEVTGLEHGPSTRWNAPVTAMGGHLEVTDGRLLLHLPAHIEELVG